MNQLTELDKATIVNALVGRNAELADLKNNVALEESQKAIQAEIEYTESLIHKILNL